MSDESAKGVGREWRNIVRFRSLTDFIIKAVFAIGLLAAPGGLFYGATLSLRQGKPLEALGVAGFGLVLLVIIVPLLLAEYSKPTGDRDE